MSDHTKAGFSARSGSNIEVPPDTTVGTAGSTTVTSSNSGSAYQVVDELDRMARLRGKPRSLRVDNGPEFAGRLVDQWACLKRVALDFWRPGKPSDNAFIEAFNSRLRQECLRP